MAANDETQAKPTAGIDAAGIGFMRTEISLGLMFAQLASAAGGGTPKRERNLANARKAYDTLVRIVPSLRLTLAEQKELRGGTEALRLAIAAIPPNSVR